MASRDVITKRQFERMNARLKGYVCYMAGARSDQPNVPERYEYKTEKARKEYEAGQMLAVLEVQDSP